ncbi:MAG: hypothetical protein ACSLEN_10935 [Candidatus Malihini olakiniferum]
MLNHSVILKKVTSNTRRVKIRLLSQSYDIEVYQDHIHIAHVYILLKYMKENAYYIVRKEKFKYYSSKSIVDFDKATRIIPERVLHMEKDNVIVNSPVFNKKRITSKVSVNIGNTAYFDYTQDHYPEMVLIEAGK